MTAYRMMVDVDDTLYDAGKLFYRMAQAEGIKGYPKFVRRWHRAHEMGVDQKTLTNMFRKCHSHEVVAQQKPFKGAVEVLQKFSESNPDVDIWYVSSRNANAETALRDWLEVKRFPCHQNVYVNMDKKDWMMMNVPEIVIDDRVQTILYARYTLGSAVLAMSMPHNQNLTNEAPGIDICDDWYEIGYKLSDIMSNLREGVQPWSEIQTTTAPALATTPSR